MESKKRGANHRGKSLHEALQGGGGVGWDYVQTAITTASEKLLGSRKRTAAEVGWGGGGVDYSPIPL